LVGVKGESEENQGNDDDDDDVMEDDDVFVVFMSPFCCFFVWKAGWVRDRDFRGLLCLTLQLPLLMTYLLH
jgi:hypothetical protein